MPFPPELQDLASRVSNWGRWGADDRRGTLNLITPEAVQRGAAAVRRGVSFSLAIPFDEDGPQTGAIPGRINPKHTMLRPVTPIFGDAADYADTDDVVEMGVQAATHWDALSHVGYGGRLYNDVPFDDVTDDGSTRLGIEHYGPIVTRGVLLDIARLHGVDHFDDAHVIDGADLDAAVAGAGVTVEAGDAVLVRTGQMHWLRQGDRNRFGQPAPGLGVGAVEWFHDRDVAAVATDTLSFEVWPCEDPNVLLPVHMLDLRDVGLVQGQLWHLDELATDCADDGVYEFLLSATPLPITGAVGGPVAPAATK